MWSTVESSGSCGSFSRSSRNCTSDAPPSGSGLATNGQRGRACARGASRRKAVERTSRRVRLTSRGQELERQVRPACETLDRALREVRGIAEGLAGPLRIGITTNSDGPPFTRLVKTFEKRHPNHTVSLHEVNPWDPYTLLRTQELDVLLNWLVVDQTTSPPDRPWPTTTVCWRWPVATASPAGRRSAWRTSLTKNSSTAAIVSTGACRRGHPTVHIVRTAPSTDLPRKHLRAVGRCGSWADRAPHNRPQHLLIPRRPGRRPHHGSAAFASRACLADRARQRAAPNASRPCPVTRSGSCKSSGVITTGVGPRHAPWAVWRCLAEAVVRSRAARGERGVVPRCADFADCRAHGKGPEDGAHLYGAATCTG